MWRGAQNGPRLQPRMPGTKRYKRSLERYAQAGSARHRAVCWAADMARAMCAREGRAVRGTAEAEEGGRLVGEDQGPKALSQNGHGRPMFVPPLLFPMVKLR